MEKKLSTQNQSDKIFLFHTYKNSINKALCYLLGFQPDFGTMLLDDETLTIFLDARYFGKKDDIDKEIIRRRLRKDNLKINFVLWHQKFEEDIKTLVGDRKLVLEKTISYSFYEKMKELGMEVDFLGDFFKDLRTVKQEDEILKMKKAIEIMDKVFFDIDRLVASGDIVGKTEREVRSFIISKIFEYGGEGESFDSIVAFGTGSAIPHYETGDVKIGNGVLLIDTGAKYQNYCSDFTRTYRIGSKTGDYELFQKIYNIVKVAYQRAAEHAYAGISCKELDAVARDYISQCGYGDCFLHSLGHGIGLDAHENFGINPRSLDFVPKDSFFTIEPGIYLDGKFGVRLENTFQMTENGAEKFAENDI